MRYQEVQVDYYDKKGMILLGFMEKRWKVIGKVRGLEYEFSDYVINRYSVKDHVQVASIIQSAIDTVKYLHPAANNVIIQSDNASDFS